MDRPFAFFLGDALEPNSLPLKATQTLGGPSRVCGYVLHWWQKSFRLKK